MAESICPLLAGILALGPFFPDEIGLSLPPWCVDGVTVPRQTTDTMYLHITRPGGLFSPGACFDLVN